MPGESDRIGQDEIESLLKQARDAGGGSAAAPDKKESSESTAALGQDEIAALLSQAENAPATKAESSVTPTSPPAAAVKEVRPVGQEEMEKLLKTGGKANSNDSRSSATKSSEDEGILSQDIDFLFREAESALASIHTDVAPLPANVSPFNWQDFGGAPASTEAASLQMLRDIDLDLKIELGRTHMYLQDILKLRRGSVVALDKMAGDPVDIYVNNRLIARGEVLVMNDNFCVRVAELIAAEPVIT
jgi:flagellar motor switch protein FliN/FliY